MAIDTSSFVAAQTRIVAAATKLQGEIDRSNVELAKAQGVIDNVAGFLDDANRIVVEQQCQQQIDSDAVRLARLATSLEAIPALAPLGG